MYAFQDVNVQSFIYSYNYYYYHYYYSSLTSLYTFYSYADQRIQIVSDLAKTIQPRGNVRGSKLDGSHVPVDHSPLKKIKRAREHPGIFEYWN